MIGIGTTAHQGFTLPTYESEITTLNAIYTQNGTHLFTKNIDDFLYDEERNIYVIELSSTDTSKFKYYNIPSKDLALVQVQVGTSDGEIYNSIVMKERVYPSLFNATEASPIFTHTVFFTQTSRGV